MDTQNLRAFLLVAETGSFSLAAEKLHLTQPAVSKRIALLEEQLGADLFDRIGRNISLTEAGNALLPHARAVQRELEAARQSVRDLSGAVAGQLRLATSHHIGLHRLPPVLSEFSRAFPAVQIDIDFMDSEQAYELIMQGKVELAIVTLAPVSERSLVTRTVWPDPLDFMVAQASPAGTASGPGPAKPWRSIRRSCRGSTPIPARSSPACSTATSLSLQVSMATNYLETIRMMASVGLGWTVLPRSMRDETLATLQLSDTSIERTLGIVYHRGRSLSRAASAFIEVVLAAADTTA